MDNKIDDKFGVERKIDSMGRITLPKEFRRFLNWDCGEKVVVYFDKDRLIITSK